MKKILVISQSTTPPVYAGNQKCILEYCEMLKELGAQVSFLYTQGFKKEHPDDLKKFSEYWGENLFIYKRSLLKELPFRIWGKIRALFTAYNFLDERYPFGLTAYVKQLQKREHFDIIIVNYITLTRLFTADIHCRKVLFAHDAFTYKLRRLQVDQAYMNLKPGDEAAGLRRCDTILSIQENESVLFDYLNPHSDIKTVYSIFPTHAEQPYTHSKNILFLSGGSQLNINGIERFVGQVLPLILQHEKEAKLIIGGSICDKIKHLAGPNVILQGCIDDVDQFYAQADIAINPVYQGTGLKIKTLEALSYGKATVVDTHSTEGLYKREQLPVLVADTPTLFAQNIISLFHESDRCKELQTKSLSYITEMNNYIKKQYKEMISL